MGSSWVFKRGYFLLMPLRSRPRWVPLVGIILMPMLMLKCNQGHGQGGFLLGLYKGALLARAFFSDSSNY